MVIDLKMVEEEAQSRERITKKTGLEEKPVIARVQRAGRVSVPPTLMRAENIEIGDYVYLWIKKVPASPEETNEE